MISLLYIDDEQDLLDLCKLYLERERGFSVDLARSAQEGLEKIQANAYDAVVSDYQMPDMDGIELLRRVRAEIGNLPFIIFTGKGREEIAMAAIDNGVNSYLHKNGDAKVQFDELAQKIRQAVRQYQAEEKMQMMKFSIDHAAEGILWIAPEGTITYVNDAAATLLDTPHDQLLGMNLQVFWPGIRGVPENFSEFWEKIQKKDFLTFDAQYTRADGNTIPVEILANYFEFEKKPYAFTTLRYVSAGTEKSGSVQAVPVQPAVTEDFVRSRPGDLPGPEPRQKTSGIKYRALVEEINDWVWEVDTGGRITFSNGRAMDILGYRPVEITGRVIYDLMPEEKRSDFSLFLSDNEIKKNPFLSLEFSLLHKDGRDVILDVHGAPILNERGEVQGFRGVGRDITGMKKVQVSLQEKSEELDRFFTTALDLLCIMDRDGYFRRLNPAWESLTGYRLDELVGKQSLDLVHPDDLVSTRETIKNLFSEGQVTGFVNRYQIADGTYRWLEWRSSVYGPGHIYSSARDITDRMRAEEAQVLANKKLNLLSDITRHDIRNQLTVFSGYLTLLREQETEPPASMYIQKLLDTTKTITAHIEFTKLYQNLGMASPDWQEVGNVFFKACSQIDLHKVQINMDVKHLEIYSDPLLERTFYNLIDNAMRYGERVTTLSVSATETEEGLTLVISDDGIGILPTDKERIFNRGFGKNTGLGLFLAREILSITGITIHETGEYQHGARFELSVPKGVYRYA